MAQAETPLLTPWANFYVMTGSSAAALTGLMFVVITLVPRFRLRRDPDGVATFSTPTVAHFCGALFISAVLGAPWSLPIHAAIPIGVCGLVGVIYVFRVMARTRRLREYVPDLEDWAWFMGLPLLAYAAIFVSAIALAASPTKALFALAGSVVLLIFIGIRNAWDVVTYIAIQDEGPPPE